MVYTKIHLVTTVKDESHQPGISRCFLLRNRRKSSAQAHLWLAGGCPLGSVHVSITSCCKKKSKSPKVCIRHSCKKAPQCLWSIVLRPLSIPKSIKDLKNYCDMLDYSTCTSIHVLALSFLSGF